MPTVLRSTSSYLQHTRAAGLKLRSHLELLIERQPRRGMEELFARGRYMTSRE